MEQKIKIAVFPGTFYPFHEGHRNIIQRARLLFDKLYIAVSINCRKKNNNTLQRRFDLIKQEISKLNLDNVFVCMNEEMVVDFAIKHHCQYIVRSIRNSADFADEYIMAQANFYLNKNIETVLFLAKDELKNISSSTILKIEETKNMINDGINSKK